MRKRSKAGVAGNAATSGMRVAAASSGAAALSVGARRRPERDPDSRTDNAGWWRMGNPACTAFVRAGAGEPDGGAGQPAAGAPRFAEWR